MAARNNEVRIVMAGEGGVGKSAITLAFVSNVWVPEHDPTIEDTHRKQFEVDGKQIMLDILDTAGQEEYETMQDQWFRSGAGFMLVFSVENRKSLNDVKALHNKILTIKGVDRVPLVLVGNKIDLEEQRLITTAEGQAVADELGCPLVETSAKLHQNIETAYQTLVKTIWEHQSPGSPEDKHPLERPRTPGKRRCIIL